MRALGVDLGTRRIGIAVSAASMAMPYEVVVRSGDRSADHRHIAAVAAETEATHVVVGLPLSLDGSVGRAARSAIDEAAELEAALGLPVQTWDERLTTVEAERALTGSLRAPQRRQVVDKVAAAVMLQSWLDARSRGHALAEGGP